MFCLYAFVVGFLKEVNLKSQSTFWLPLFSSSKVMDSQAQTKIPVWIDGRYAFIFTYFMVVFHWKSFICSNPSHVWSSYSFVLVLHKGTRSALALRDVSTDSETFLQNLEALLTWVCEIEELAANQKPPSSEVKVVKAQLQEQKVCYHQHHMSLFSKK